MTIPITDDIPRYSGPALEVLREFYDCSVMIFVEGDDDILFWAMICDRAGVSSFKIDSVGGKEQLLERMSRVVDEGAKIIVACDADHSPFLLDSVLHPFVVRTYGYSIENTLYCPVTLNHFIRKLARTVEDFSVVTAGWMAEFCASAYRLLLYDIANHRFAKEVQVFGDSCARFLSSSRSHRISTERINAYLSNISTQFSDSEINECEVAVQSSQRDLRHLVKGHFLTLAVVNWVKNHVGKKLSISLDHLYAGTVDSCRHCTSDSCDELRGMCDDIRRAFEAIEAGN